MSGGSYDYFYLKLDEVADEVRVDAGCRAYGQRGDLNSGAAPELRLRFKAHLKLVASALKAVEWNDSGDGDDDEEALIRACLGEGQTNPRPKRECAKCTFFLMRENGGGECRRQPPVVLSLGASPTHWPKVAGDDWCGEFVLGSKA